MKINEIFPVAIGVLTNPYVIAVAIFVLIYCSFVSYIVRYKKKPPRPKIEKSSKPSVSESAEQENSSESEESVEEE